MNERLNLAASIRHHVDAPPDDALAIRDVDCDADGAIIADAGLLAAIDVVGAALAEGQMMPAFLLMGTLADQELRVRAAAIPGALRLLDWPGTVYCRYGSDIEDLKVAAAAALAGRVQPFPSANAHELCGQLADVMHWLDRFRQGALGARRIVSDVEKGHLLVSALRPKQWLSQKHLSSLNRLVAALTLSEHAVAGPVLRDARDRFLAAAFRFEREKQRISEQHLDDTIGISSLSNLVAQLVSEATVICNAIAELDSIICNAKIADQGAGND